MPDRLTLPSSQSHSPKPGPDRSWLSHRTLNEPVLSSAQEELDVKPNPYSDKHSGATFSEQTHQSAQKVQSDQGDQLVWWSRPQEQFMRYVSEQPGRAALMAVGAGAVAALLLGLGLSSRRRKE